jgi:hypothetical protein
MKSALPTRKWVAAQLVFLAGIAINAVDTGWSAIETKALILWAVQAATTYLVPNEDTPAGVPLKRSRVAGQGLVEVVLFLLALILIVVLLRALL